MVMIFITSSLMQTSYSTFSLGKPNIMVTIFSNGTIETEGNLFGEDLWYPGKEKSGVIRINNYYKPIYTDDIGFEINLEKYNRIYTKDSIYNEFNNKMRLTLSRGKLDAISTKIIDNVSLEQLIKGYNFEERKRFIIEKNDFVDLKYTLTMHEEAGNELQNITATISMTLNVNERAAHEQPINGGKGSNGGNASNGGNGSDGWGTNIEKPVEKPIPWDIKDHWAKNCILWLIEKGIITGYEDGTIRPNNYITRAETAALLARAFKLETSDKLYSGYLDPIPYWARGYILALTEQEIFIGSPANGGRVFMANAFITREQTVAVFIRAFSLCLEEEVELGFIDKDEISEWALDYVKAGVGNRILNGYPDNTLRPKNSITRAEVFAILCRLLKMSQEVVN
ncbi:S-layer homology domain-containing protein [Serpentinicella alkaliphila]|nr:S-layer homology domain-containing protein [Serpentinicella alkaliphila]QUH25269.1 S-layer homology domain-containing protein [Serpentinicella alkaliphila]